MAMPEMVTLSMNPCAALPLIAFLVDLCLGAYVLHKNPERPENKVFALLMASFALMSLAEFPSYLLVDKELILFDAKILWTSVSFIGSIFMHFILIFPRRRRILEKKLIYPVIYLPSFVFLYSVWFTDLFITGVKTVPWAEYTHTYGILFDIWSVYFEFVLITGLYLFWTIYKTSRVKMEKNQSKYMLIATSIPVIGGSINSIILPAWGIYVFEITSSLTALMAAIIAYAMLRFRLMSLMPLALKNVVGSMLDGVVVTDALGYVSKVNSSAMQLLDFKSGVIGKRFSEVVAPVLSGAEDADKFRSLLDNAGTLPDKVLVGQLVLQKPDKRILDVNISPVKDKTGEIIGQTTVFHDVTAVKKAEGDLRNKMEELERFNKLSVGRELKMIELKKRIEELEKKSGRLPGA